MIEGVKLPGATVEAQSGPAKDDPAKIRDAAEQFETLLVAQILKTARESGSGGWMGSGEDQASETAVGVAEEHMARALAARGGLGLTSTIVKGLEKK